MTPFSAHENVTFRSGPSILHAKTKVTSQTLIKTGSAATTAGCDVYLHCTPNINAKHLGTNTVHNNDDSDCPIEISVRIVGTTTPTGADKMWKHAPASCDSTVTREDVDGKG